MFMNLLKIYIIKLSVDSQFKQKAAAIKICRIFMIQLFAKTLAKLNTQNRNNY